jgi:hypothetical protein
MAQSRYGEAEPLLITADQGLAAIPGEQGHERTGNRARLASLYDATGHPELAAAYR